MAYNIKVYRLARLLNLIYKATITMNATMTIIYRIFKYETTTILITKAKLQNENNLVNG